MSFERSALGTTHLTIESALEVGRLVPKPPFCGSRKVTRRRHLHHKTPGWVESGAQFHVRLRVSGEQSLPLTDLRLSKVLIAAARDYHEREKWWCELVLLMPDHLHALIAFPGDPGMSTTMKNWKRAVARLHNVKWQSNFFDHRIRNLKEGNETWHYVLNNPIVKGLCRTESEWPHWWSGAVERD